MRKNWRRSWPKIALSCLVTQSQLLVERQALTPAKAFMATIAGIKHDLADVWKVDDNIVARMTVTYTRREG